MLTFVQKRPIGLGIKNNLGSLYWLRALFLLSLCLLRLFMLSRRSFRRTLREVLLDIYSRTSCSWCSLSPNFPENWKNMLLNAFLLTYVCGILLFFPVEDHEIRTSLSLFLSSTCCTLSLFLLDKSFVSLLQLRFAWYISYKIHDSLLTL